MSQQHPMVQEALERLKSKATLHKSKEEAWAASRAKAAPLTDKQNEQLDNVVFAETGCKPISLYLPEQLIEQLTELEEEGIDPHELAAGAIESAVKLALSVLAHKAIPVQTSLEAQGPRDLTDPPA